MMILLVEEAFLKPVPGFLMTVLNGPIFLYFTAVSANSLQNVVVLTFSPFKNSEEMQFEDKNNTYRNQTKSKRRSQNQNETARSFHLVTTQPPILKSQEPKSLYRNVTTSIKKSVQAEPTELRRNPYYYQIYYVYLNTIFASLLPLFLLLFFNMQTARELFKMSKLETRTLVSRASNVNLNRRATMVDFNPRGTAEDPRVEALRLAADAHGLANGTNEALLAAHQNCAYETTSALPVITLTEEEAAKNERVSQKCFFFIDIPF